jgi:hypothetical protein
MWPSPSALARLLAAQLLAAETAGHGAVTFPRPRNAVDAATPFGAACSNPGAQRGNVTAPGNGQACVRRALLLLLQLLVRSHS